MKTFRLIVLFAFVAFALSACSAMQQGAAQLQQLPDDGRVLVLSLITAGATWVLLKASEFFKIELQGYANAVAAALAPIVITLFEAGLQLIPPIFDNIVLSIIHLLVLLVGSLGAFFLFKRQSPSLR